MLKCQVCDQPIYERHLCKIDGDYWHQKCLKCSICLTNLTDVCHLRNGRLFCKEDYYRSFGNICATCNGKIEVNEKIFKTGGPNENCPIHFSNDQLKTIIIPQGMCLCQPNSNYHVKCFICCVCERRLEPGESYICRGSALFCSREFRVQEPFMDSKLKFNNSINTDDEDVVTDELEISFQGDNLLLSRDEEDEDDEDASTYHDEDVASTNEVDSDNDSFRNSKRPRTILTAAQRRRFKHAFEMNPKPTRKIRENLANETGLNVRVVQVWFQNQRAKVKKIARRQNQENNNQIKRSMFHISSQTQEHMQHLFPFQPFNQMGSKMPSFPAASLSNGNFNSSDSNSDLSIQKISNDYSLFDLKQEQPLAENSSQKIPDTLFLTQVQKSEKNYQSNHSNSPKSDTKIVLSSTTQNPINRLFSMQESYFTV